MVVSASLTGTDASHTKVEVAKSAHQMNGGHEEAQASAVQPASGSGCSRSSCLPLSSRTGKNLRCLAANSESSLVALTLTCWSRHWRMKSVRQVLRRVKSPFGHIERPARQPRNLDVRLALAIRGGQFLPVNANAYTPLAPAARMGWSASTVCP